MMSRRVKNKIARRGGPVSRTGTLKTDRHFVEALARGLEILASFRQKDGLLGNQELARRCGLAKSTVSRLTYTLTKLGYLTHVEEVGKYGLGTATLSLASAMLGRLDIRKLARPRMQELADFSKCLISLSSRDRLSMVYVDVARSSAAVTLSLDTGARIQIATSATGRAYLTAIPEKEREEVMEGVREIAATSRWPALQRGVAKALIDIRTLGVCCSFGEWQKDVNAIAVRAAIFHRWPSVAARPRTPCRRSSCSMKCGRASSRWPRTWKKQSARRIDTACCIFRSCKFRGNVRRCSSDRSERAL
jgi:DNA-binding IclR family transcriptional regulator